MGQASRFGVTKSPTRCMKVHEKSSGLNLSLGIPAPCPEQITYESIILKYLLLVQICFKSIPLTVSTSFTFTSLSYCLEPTHSFSAFILSSSYIYSTQFYSYLVGLKVCKGRKCLQRSFVQGKFMQFYIDSEGGKTRHAFPQTKVLLTRVTASNHYQSLKVHSQFKQPTAICFGLPHCY